MELDRTERRILGALIEKRLSTPDQYPLTLKALIAACNQKSNRDPVLTLQEFEVEGALMALREKGLTLIREREGGWAKRYAEKLSGELGVDDRGAAVLSELMLRGPQTAPELLRRMGRMVPTDHMNQVDETLSALAGLHLVRLLPKGSGQRHARWEHRLAPAAEASEPAAEPAPAAPPDAASAPPAPEPAAPPAPAAPTAPRAPAAPPVPSPDVVSALREEIEVLRDEVSELRDRVGRLEDAWR